MSRIEKLVERASLALMVIIQRWLKKRYADYIEAGGFFDPFDFSRRITTGAALEET